MFIFSDAFLYYAGHANYRCELIRLRPLNATVTNDIEQIVFKTSNPIASILRS